MDSLLRNLIRDRAAGRCEYCRLPESAVKVRHVIDHIISRKHKGTNSLENLAFSCVTCNRNKGTDVAGVDSETDQIIRLYNPRRDIWADHFKWSGNQLIGLTPIGRATIETLDMNGILQMIIRQATQAEWPQE